MSWAALIMIFVNVSITYKLINSSGQDKSNHACIRHSHPQAHIEDSRLIIDLKRDLTGAVGKGFGVVWVRI